MATISTEEIWVHTRLKPGRFTLKGNWGSSLLIVNLFCFPCMQKSWGAIFPRYLESVSDTERHTQVGFHSFPVDGSIPAHDT